MATCNESEDEDIYDRPLFQSAKDSRSDDSCINVSIPEKEPEISVHSHTVQKNDVKYETSVVQSDETINEKDRRKKKGNGIFFLRKKTDTIPSQDKNSGDNFKPKKKRKTSGEAAVEAWRLEEKQFEQAAKQRKKNIRVRRGLLSTETFEAMANAYPDGEKKPKIKKKEKPQLTEKILKVLIAVGDGKLNHFFNESEVARVSSMQTERVHFLKKLSQKKELRWLNMLFEKDLKMENGNDATKMEEEDNERASAIIDLIMKCGQQNQSSLASFLANKSIDIDALYYMEGCIKYKMEDSVTSNPAESLNALFQAQIDKRELAIDELAYSIYYFAGVFYNDIIRGYYDDGNFELLKKYSSKKKGSAFEIPENKLLKLPEFSDFNKWIIEQEGPVFEGEQKIDLRKVLLVTAIDNFKIHHLEDNAFTVIDTITITAIDNFKIYHLEDNVFTVIDTITSRKATVTLGETARKDECTCRQQATCLHILAAKKLIGKELTANERVGDPMKDEKRQRNKKVGRHGRKRRQRKDVVEHTDESTEALSPVQKAAKKEHEVQHSNAMRSIRAYIKQV
uniref:SWIM-type domain-containing protein n=1 Tax=Panagrolaimus sp. PS1159 TaxID=55785 RepID=A0AC35FD97_9BILA